MKVSGRKCRWSFFPEKLKLQAFSSSHTCSVQTIPRNELSGVFYFLINPVLLFGISRMMFKLNERTGKFREYTIQGGVLTPSTSAALFCFKLDFKINLIFHLKLLSFPSPLSLFILYLVLLSVSPWRPNTTFYIT